MKWLFSFVVVLLLSAVSFAQEHTITGIALDKRTLEPLVFEQVMLYRKEKSDTSAITNIHPPITVVTDIDGYFSFSNLTPGTYLISIKTVIEGLYPYERELIVTEKDGVTALRIELTDKSGISTYD